MSDSVSSPCSEEKQQVAVQHPLDLVPSASLNGPRRHVHWRPSFFHVGPLIGLLALLFALLTIFASFGVLNASNGKPVASWQLQPNVYLAILTAVSNKALAFAVIQGTVVTFWLNALSGTTLGELHRTWVSVDLLSPLIFAFNL